MFGCAKNHLPCDYLGEKSHDTDMLALYKKYRVPLVLIRGDIYACGCESRDHGADKEQRRFGDDDEKRNHGSDNEERAFRSSGEKRNHGHHLEQRHYGSNEEMRRYGADDEQRRHGRDEEQRAFGADSVGVTCSQTSNCDGFRIFVPGAPTLIQAYEGTRLFPLKGNCLE